MFNNWNKPNQHLKLGPQSQILLYNLFWHKTQKFPPDIHLRKKLFKGPEATCLKIVLRWKNTLIWKTCSISMFPEISDPCFNSIIYKIRKQLSSFVIPNKFMLPFWNLQKTTIIFRTAKPTLAGSLKSSKISLKLFL